MLYSSKSGYQPKRWIYKGVGEPKDCLFPDRHMRPYLVLETSTYAFEVPGSSGVLTFSTGHSSNVSK